MNRFIIEKTPQEIAASLCDQHVVKMPLEEAQMLCTALWHHAPQYAEDNNLYKLYGQCRQEVITLLLGDYILQCL